MPIQYYIKRGEKVRGPISRQQLNKLKVDGKLKATDLISDRSDGGWKPVSGKRSEPTERAAEPTPANSGQPLPPRRSKRKVKRKSQPKTSSGKGRRTLLTSSVAAIVLLVAGLSWMFWPSAESDAPVARDTESAVPAPAAPVDILAFVDPVDCMIDGTANTQHEGGLILDRSQSRSNEARLEFPVVLPTEYELTIEMERLTSKCGVAISVPHGVSEATILIDGFYGSGIAQIDGESYKTNPSNVSDRNIFDEKALRQIRILSKNNHLAVYVDEEKLTEFEGDPQRLSPHSDATHPNFGHPFVRVTENVRLTAASVHPVTGEVVRALPSKLTTPTSIAGATGVYGNAFPELLAVLERTGGGAQLHSERISEQCLYVNCGRKSQLTADDITTISKLQGPVFLMLGSGTSDLAKDAKTVDVCKTLGQMPHLTGLGLWNNDILDDERMKALAQSQSLRMMTLDSHRFTPAEVESLGRITTLRELRISYCRGLSDSTLLTLTQDLQNLEVLTLAAAGDAVTDASTAMLSELPRLRVLTLSKNRKITDDSISHLLKIAQLDTLEVEDTSITQAGFENLKTGLPNTKIKWRTARKKDAPAPPAKDDPAPPAKDAPAPAASAPKSTQKSAEPQRLLEVWANLPGSRTVTHVRLGPHAISVVNFNQLRNGEIEHSIANTLEFCNTVDWKSRMSKDQMQAFQSDKLPQVIEAADAFYAKRDLQRGDPQLCTLLQALAADGTHGVSINAEGLKRISAVFKKRIDLVADIKAETIRHEKPLTTRGTLANVNKTSDGVIVNCGLEVCYQEQMMGTRTVCKTVMQAREVGGRIEQFPVPVQEQVPYTYTAVKYRTEERTLKNVTFMIPQYGNLVVVPHDDPRLTANCRLLVANSADDARNAYSKMKDILSNIAPTKEHLANSAFPAAFVITSDTSRTNGAEPETPTESSLRKPAWWR